MSPQYRAALGRAAFMGLLAAAAAAVTWAASDPKYAVYAAIAGAFLSRFVAEGGYDTGRDKKGQISDADVGAK